MSTEIIGYRVIQDLFPVCGRVNGEVIPLGEIGEDLRPDLWVVAGFCVPVADSAKKTKGSK